MPFRRSRSRLRLRKNFRNQFAGSNKPVPRAPDGHSSDSILDSGFTYNNPEDQFYNALETPDILTYNDFKYFPFITEMENLYEDNENNVNVVASVEEMFRNIVVSPKDFRDLNNILKAYDAKRMSSTHHVHVQNSPADIFSCFMQMRPI